MNGKKLAQLIISLVIGVVIAILPPPNGLDQPAMIFIGIFICAIMWLVFDVVSDVIAVMLAMCLCIVLNISDIKTVFSPFASSSVWLVIGALGISVVVGKVGLLKRIAFAVLSVFPENFKGQILAFFTTGIVISPLIPSVTAKSAILAPFSAEAASALGFQKGSKGSRGIFAAMWISSGILGYAFLSGAIPVVTILGFMTPEQSARFTWIGWFVSAVVWLILVTVLSFVAIMLLFNPSKDKTDVAVEKGFAKKSLAALGPMTKDEKLAASFLALALIGWMTGQWHHIDSGVWSIIILCLMGITGLITKSEFTSKISWSTVYFVGGIFSLAAMISKFGIDKWLAVILKPFLTPVVSNPYILVPVICVATYLVRYVIISQTATTAIFFATLGGIAQAVGIHPYVILFTCYMSTQVWHFSFTNVTYTAAFGATGGNMVSHKDNQPINIAFMIINMIACTASVPLWHMLGLL